MSGEIVDVLKALGAPGQVGMGLVVLRHVFPPVADAMGEHLAQGYRSAIAASGSLFLQAIDKARTFRGMIRPTKAPKANVIIPLIESALLEEDELLRAKWAEMLLNAMDTNCSVEVTRNYISILQDCSSLDVQNLSRLYEARCKQPTQSQFFTMHLPDRVTSDVLELKIGGEPGLLKRSMPNTKVLLSLWNIRRLRLIDSAVLNEGDLSMSIVNITALGVGLVEACTAPQAAPGFEEYAAT